MYLKRLMLFFAILTIFGCAKQMFENDSPLTYHGSDKFLQQISQQAMELDKKLNFSAKLMNDGVVNWDSVSYQAGIADPEIRIILLPVARSGNNKSEFIKFKVENMRLLEAPVLINETRISSTPRITLAKKIEIKKNKSTGNGSRMTMSSLCRVEVFPVVEYDTFGSGSVFDPGYWTYMANSISAVLTSNGCEVGQATAVVGQSITITTDAFGVYLLQNQSFFETYRVGYNYPWIRVYRIEHQFEPEVSCDGDGGGTPGTDTPPDVDDETIDWGAPTDEDLEVELDANEENLNGEIFTDKRYVWKFHKSYNEGFWLNSYEKARVKRSSSNNLWMFASFTHLTQQPVGMPVGREIEIVMIDNTVEMTSTRAKVSLWYKIHRIGSGFGTTLPYYSSDFYKSKEFQPNE